MANTYSKIYIHIVFTVKGRQNLIQKKYREQLHKYISGIIKNKGQKLLSIFAMPDHIHLFMNVKPNITISDLVRDIKTGSSKFINEKNLVKGKFSWQKGFGVFSYSESQIPSVIKYIENQEEHHKKKTFREEYIKLLTKFAIEFDEMYLFEWME